MEEKIKSKKGNNQEKIKWYHARWFWGVVIGVVVVLGFYFYMSIPPIRHDFLRHGLFNQLILLFWPRLLLGITATLSFFFGKGPYFLVNKIVHAPIIYLFTAIYYLLILLLLYKTFQNRKVSLKYPFIIIIIFIVSLFGIMISNILS